MSYKTLEQFHEGYYSKEHFNDPNMLKIFNGYGKPFVSDKKYSYAMGLWHEFALTDVFNAVKFYANNQNDPFCLVMLEKHCSEINPPLIGSKYFMDLNFAERCKEKLEVLSATNDDAIVLLALCYGEKSKGSFILKEKHDPKNLMLCKCLNLLESASKKGILYASFRLGAYYTMVEDDNVKALSYYKKGLNDGKCLVMIGEFYRQMASKSSDTEKYRKNVNNAIKYLTKAVDIGYYPAYSFLASCYKNGSPEYKKHMETGSKYCDRQSLSNMATMLIMTRKDKTYEDKLKLWNLNNPCAIKHKCVARWYQNENNDQNRKRKKTDDGDSSKKSK